MARSCGIRIGPRRFELVVLDGSAKKSKITAYTAGDFPAGSDDPVGDAVSVLKEAVKAHNLPKENVSLVIDSGKAAFRRVTLPFSDRAKIEQVLKFEVESQLPQWNIDDVVVDFHVANEGSEGSELLVTAVPKAQLADTLDLCTRSGLEPLEAELETTAMVNAAIASDLCHFDDAQVLVHVGERATSVVVVDAGEVRDMRVIHLGALTHETLLASAEPSAAEEPAEGEKAGDEADADADADAFAATPEPEADAEAQAMSQAEVARRLDQAIKRIRRELGRTISAARTINPISSVYICGMELPGLVGTEVLDVPVYILDCFDEDGGQPADGFGELVVAYGAALRGLGNVPFTSSLRREELRYTGTMERLEFPLAVTSLLMCFFLAVFYILKKEEYSSLQNGAYFWLRSSNNYLLGNMAKGDIGRMRGDIEELGPLHDYKKIFEAPGGKDPVRGPVEALSYMNQEVYKRVELIRGQLGQTGGSEQPQSAFQGMLLVMDLLRDHSLGGQALAPGETPWRPSVRGVRAQYQPGSGSQQRPDLTKVSLELVFFAEDTITATGHYSTFQRLLREQPWFNDLEVRGSEPLENGKGIITNGSMEIMVDVEKHYAAKRAALLTTEESN